ncbi:MAG: DUF4153 domain-containing protein [Alphaproteobacteria bacterium]
MKNLIEKLFPVDELIATIKRFPLSVMCALGVFIIAILGIHDLIDYDEDFMARIVVILSCSYLWFGISKLMSESQSLNFIKHGIVAGMGVALISSLIFLSSLWTQNLLFLSPAILLILMVAPYLKGGDDTSVWFFNRQMWFGIAVSYIALLMFAGGVCVALWAIEALFEVHISEEIFFDIWAFSCLVLGPVYALSWVPRQFEFTEDDCRDPAGLSFIVNWISAPMAIVYLCILYAYFGKIIIDQEVPKGILAYMISGFVGAGVVTYLVSWPLRESGSVQLRLFHKVFFPALIIPVGFHFFAIWERISAYGVTEQRYFILITAVWFMIIALGNVKGKMPIKAIPASLAILLVFASFGPWGAVSISGISQFARLESLLVKNELLVDGNIIKRDEDSVSREDQISIGSIIDYLCQTDRDAMIAPWFNADGKADWRCYSGHNLTEHLGFKDAYSYNYGRGQDESRINIWTSENNNKPRDISGYDFMVKNGGLKFLGSQGCSSSSCKIDKPDLVEVYRAENSAKLVFKYESIVIAEYDFSAFLLEHKDDQNSDKYLFIEFENERIKMRMDIQSAYGEIKDDKPVLNSMGYDILYSFKDAH